jgi:hypothetical protein
MRLLVVFLSLGICAVARAQVSVPTAPKLAPAASSLSFDARLVSNGGTARNDQTGPKAPYTTAQNKETRSSKMTVEIRARNFAAAPADAQLEWYFIARDLQSKKPYVWDQGTRELKLAAGSEQKETVESAELYQTTTKTSENHPLPAYIGQTPRYQASSSKQEWGAKPYGWIVRMRAGGRVVLVRASSNDLETMASGLDPVVQ